MIRNKIRLSLAVLSLMVFMTGCGSVSQTSAQQSDAEASGVSINDSRATGASAVRGVWLTNVDSKVLNSNAGIVDAVKACREMGFNTIFPVVWNKGYTLYPSATMKKEFDVEIDSNFAGRDPLRELIVEAHKYGIKVIPWFEFGFAASFKADGGHLIAAKPHWKAIDRKGKLVTKNGFEWMNGFHPEVQEFMLSLIREVVTNYDVDGVQGDDRLPAMPSESGYDAYTTGLYKAARNGKEPPADQYEADWLQFRADLMTEFGEKLYRLVKSIKPEAIVSLSPSIYPFAKEEYLQDWPEWARRGTVELLCPQVYRRSLEPYIETLHSDFSNIPKGKEHIYYPGILIKLGTYYPEPEFLLQMIEENRKKGIAGEVFFFYEGLKNFKDLFKTRIYPDKVDFPKLTK